MKSNAHAVWEGPLKEGKGRLTTESGVLTNTPYSFSMRFEDEQGTTPEELIATAHSGCFSMALSMLLGEAGYIADTIHTDAEVSLEKKDDGFEVASSHLVVKASVSHIDEDKFHEIANKAKDNCPISKLLNANIQLEAFLNS